MLTHPNERPRRLRRNPLIRDLVAETSLSLAHLVQPFFLSRAALSDPSAKEPITGFDDVYRWGIDALSREIEAHLDRGLSSFLIFGTTDAKTSDGSAAYDARGAVPGAVRALKTRFGESALLMTDVCLCPYTAEAHCGIVREGEVLNDPSVEILSQMALVHAQAGADFVAPSDMMDGRVGAIRRLLDQKQFQDVGILAYTAKYQSHYYGPFREALGSGPQGGDRSSYQMDGRNRNEALRELRLDVAEGADIVMVKPALAYLDVITTIKQSTDLPVAAYSVSGEYQMVRSMASAGLADGRGLALENLTSIRRAGADIIITYAAAEIAEKGWLK